MKKVIVTFFVLCNGFVVFSQDCLDKVAKQAVEINNLKNDKKTFLDTIAKLNKKSKKLQSQNESLQKDKDKLKKKLNKKNIEELETQLLNKTDSITLLKSEISRKEDQIAAIKRESTQKEQQKYTDGQQNAYDQIAKSYKDSFDELIKSSTKFSIERDLMLVGNNETVKKDLQDLQKYFAAQQVLVQQYTKVGVRRAQAQLDNIQQSELVKSLADKLGKYELCNEALKTTIGKILEIDKKFKANDDYSQEMKLRDILFELTWYFRNYRFNFSDYPYLSDIVLEIMKLKQKDANTDISPFLNEL